MAVQFQNYVVRNYQWTDWKTVTAAKGLVVQCDDDGIVYTIYGYDGPEVITCGIWKGEVPQGAIDGGYSQAQNDSDKSDFETNYKPSANAAVEPKAADGRPSVRTTVASKTKNFQLKIFSFKTGDGSTLVNKDSNYNNLSDITMTCYDGSGAVTTDPLLAVKTVLDWEPTYNFEIIGGWTDLPPSIAGGTTGEWWLSTIMVPDIPPSSGGSVNSVTPANLEAVYSGKITLDGRSMAYLVYNATYHTNKIRWIIKHPILQHLLFQIFVETNL